ncbi:hypothetical protein J2X42_004123 [Arthrobacter sp. BE255]|nr:hypothetical protein [Arthrobacter sp. BE255]
MIAETYYLGIPVIAWTVMATASFAGLGEVRGVRLPYSSQPKAGYPMRSERRAQCFIHFAGHVRLQPEVNVTTLIGCHVSCCK